MNVLEEMLRNADYAESVSVLPAGDNAASVPLAAGIERMDGMVQRKGDTGDTFTVYAAKVKVLVSAYAAPAIGDSWTLAKCRGGQGVSGWKAGAPRGHDGFWEIPVELWERVETGKGRRNS